MSSQKENINSATNGKKEDHSEDHVSTQYASSTNGAPNHPRMPPTPLPDTHNWSDLPNTNGNSHRPVLQSSNGINGSGIRRRQGKNVHIMDDKENRPIFTRGHDSSASIDSLYSDVDINGLRHAHTINGRVTPLETSHRVEPFGPHTSTPNGPQSKAHAKIKTYSDEPGAERFPRISRPVELLRNSYDTVVIGSGYGGGVAASRMARAGQSVCLLERGKERWPGEYPSGFIDAMKQFHVSGNFAPGFLNGMAVEGGDPTGLYHLICGKGQNAFVGNVSLYLLIKSKRFLISY